jgi:hypothetical protein
VLFCVFCTYAYGLGSRLKRHSHHLKKWYLCTQYHTHIRPHTCAHTQTLTHTHTFTHTRSRTHAQVLSSIEATLESRESKVLEGWHTLQQQALALRSLSAGGGAGVCASCEEQGWHTLQQQALALRSLSAGGGAGVCASCKEQRGICVCVC